MPAQLPAKRDIANTTCTNNSQGICPTYGSTSRDCGKLARSTSTLTHAAHTPSRWSGMPARPQSAAPLHRIDKLLWPPADSLVPSRPGSSNSTTTRRVSSPYFAPSYRSHPPTGHHITRTLRHTPAAPPLALATPAAPASATAPR